MPAQLMRGLLGLLDPRNMSKSWDRVGTQGSLQRQVLLGPNLPEFQSEMLLSLPWEYTPGHCPPHEDTPPGVCHRALTTDGTVAPMGTVPRRLLIGSAPNPPPATHPLRAWRREGRSDVVGTRHPER